MSDNLEVRQVRGVRAHTREDFTKLRSITLDEMTGAPMIGISMSGDLALTADEAMHLAADLTDLAVRVRRRQEQEA